MAIFASSQANSGAFQAILGVLLNSALFGKFQLFLAAPVASEKLSKCRRFCTFERFPSSFLVFCEALKYCFTAILRKIYYCPEISFWVRRECSCRSQKSKRLPKFANVICAHFAGIVSGDKNFAPSSAQYGLHYRTILIRRFSLSQNSKFWGIFLYEIAPKCVFKTTY